MDSRVASNAKSAKPLQLWLAHPGDLLDEANAQACAALLDEEERARWQRYRFEKNRREYLATHALARIALSSIHPLAPDAWRFAAHAYGKPSIQPDCGLRFNLSNAPGMVVCLIAHGLEVGVDVEPVARAERILALAPQVFSALEVAQLEDLSGPEKLDRAVSLWTLKEAYIKARGMGLRLPLRKVSFVFGGAEGIRLELEPDLEDEAERWQFCLLDHAAHRIAVMTERSPEAELQMWKALPLLSPPKRLPVSAKRWFSQA